MKKYSLTEEHKEILKTWKDQWIANGMSTKPMDDYDKNEIPSNAILQKTDLLWKGENHHHKVRGNFEIYKNGENLFLNSLGCELYHEEHKTIQIKIGIFVLDIVNEYDHIKQESRKVID